MPMRQALPVLRTSGLLDAALVLALLPACGRAAEPRKFPCTEATVVRHAEDDGLEALFDLKVGGKVLRASTGPRSPAYRKGQRVVGLLVEIEPERGRKAYVLSSRQGYRERYCSATREAREKAARDAAAKLVAGTPLEEARRALDDAGFVEWDSDFEAFPGRARDAVARFHGWPGVMVTVPLRQELAPAGSRAAWTARVSGPARVEPFTDPVFK